MRIEQLDPSRASGTLMLAGGLFLLCCSATAQISLVRVTPCGPGAFPATICAIPSTGGGNLLVIGFEGNKAADVISSISDNVGNIYTEAGNAKASDSGSSLMGDIWYVKNANSGATAVTITPNPSGATGTITIWEFSGVDTTSPLDQTAVLNNQAASSTPSGATVATATPVELIVSLAVVQNNVSGIYPGNQFTNDEILNGNGFAHLITSLAGTYTAQWNQSPSGTYASSTVTFKAAGSSGSGGTGTSSCDLNGDGTVNVLDVQLATDMDLGLLPCTADINGAGVCNSTVVQRVVNAALGSACVVTHSASLAWTASISGSLTGYNVYRGTTSGGPYTKLGSVAATTNSYVDSNVQSGQTYYYVATAVDTSGNESAFSNQAQAVIPTP